jgi:hypothetical protein
MDNHSSKICTKCYSAQEPHARFCDSCGKPFAATAATDGNISMITKTFIKRQVAETRPLFWLCIILVGMMTVFGFAQAGIFRSEPAGSAEAATQKPQALMTKDDGRQDLSEVSEKTVTPPTDTLDLNNSVFEMGERSATARNPIKRRTATVYEKPVMRVAKPDAATVTETKRTDLAANQEIRPTVRIADAEMPTKKYTRGPMGGCYYISASGSKRYVDRGLCN